MICATLLTQQSIYTRKKSISMNVFRKVFEQTDIVIILAIICGFILPVTHFKIIDILLGIIFFLSVRSFFKHPLTISQKIPRITSAFVLNYVVLSGIYVLAGLLFFRQSFLFDGYILLAIVPPAIAIVPLCTLTKCDIESTDVALFVSYIASLFIVPLSILFIYHSSFDLWILLRVIGFVMIIPGILAYLARNSTHSIFNYSKSIVNILFGVILYTGIALNRELIFSAPRDVLTVFVVNVIIVFGLGFGAYLIGKHLFKKSDAIMYGLYASHKNVSTSIAIAILLFTPTVALPSVVSLILQFVFFIVFERFLIRYF